MKAGVLYTVVLFPASGNVPTINIMDAQMKN